MTMMTTADAVRALAATDRSLAAASACGPDAAFETVFTDSRAVVPGGLFVALRGERFDGHAFVAAALAAGAAAAMVDAEAAARSDWSSLPLVVVPDTRRGLVALAAAWRARFHLPVIGVVGSNGKTTTKEMTAAILAAAYGRDDVLATVGNLNNDIGVPLTLLGLRARHRAAVIEIGMNHPGETAELAAIARPTIGLVNNAQREHQEFMRSVADVAAEHGALIAALPADGVAIVNDDDEYAGYWRDLARSRGVAVRSFGLAREASGEQPTVGGHCVLGADASEIRIRLPEGEASVRLAIPGLHNVRNALGAAAAASAAGAAPEAIARGLAAFAPVKGRLQVKRARSGATVIDDTYNANPDSVRAAIDVLAHAHGATTLVLGDMGEVGEQGEAFHAEVGGYARERGIGRLYAAGEATRASVAAFGAGAAHFASVEALVDALDPAIAGTVLVKGSRFMRMERVVAALVNENDNNNKDRR